LFSPNLPPMTNTKEFKTDKPTLAEIRRRKQPAEKAADICIDPTLVRQYEQITDQIDFLQRQTRRGESLADSTQRQVDDLRAQLAPLEKEIMEATVTFIARDPGRKRFEGLVTAHRPTDEQKKEHKDSGELVRTGALSWNTETFVPALMSMCFVQPEMSYEEAYEICDEWGNGEISRLFQLCLSVCTEVTTIPKFRSGTELTSSTALNSTTALNGESPTPNS